jgi:D-alanyl-D-alanine carboxypeptidase/D-alanyl-D-alanine-endopeptidase (penicillin-binding protein 4)
MFKRPEKDAYFNALPILGVDGTLAETVSHDSPAKGKVCAKSGTLMWYDLTNDRILLKSKALAGKIETKKGSTLFFAIFLNDLALSNGNSPIKEGKVLGKLCEIIYRNGP